MKIISYISVFMIPVLILYILGYGLIAKRNIYNDIINHPEFTGEWSNAIVTAILLGPIEGNSANFDDLRFIRE